MRPAAPRFVKTVYRSDVQHRRPRR